MDLYFSAATVLQKLDRREGSIKGLTLQGEMHKCGGSASAGHGDKKNAVRLYALVLETLKYREVLDAIILSSGLLTAERKLAKEKELTLVLVHDALLNKRGILARHPLQAAVDRHRARLKAELTKLQLRRGAMHVRELARADDAFVARWARVNRVRLDLPSAVAQLARAGYRQVSSLAELGERADRRFCIDAHIPDLLSFHPDAKVTEEPLYRSGALILQNKASCMPAHLLKPPRGSLVLDGCAAPGNKTSHVAAILHAQHARTSASPGDVRDPAQSKDKGKRKRKRGAEDHAPSKTSQVVAFERDPRRVLVLRSMLDKAGFSALPDDGDAATPDESEGGVVMRVLHEDFTRIPPTDPRVRAATHIMLDPSCSGSGIVNRLDYLTASTASGQAAAVAGTAAAAAGNGNAAVGTSVSTSGSGAAAENELEQDIPTTSSPGHHGDGRGGESDRLASLAAFQLAILQHAMSYPLAQRIVYSTCSVHAAEDEAVVVAALLGQRAAGASSAARRARDASSAAMAEAEASGWSPWRVAPRATAMPEWPVRGRLQAVVDAGYPPTAGGPVDELKSGSGNGRGDGSSHDSGHCSSAGGKKSGQRNKTTGQGAAAAEMTAVQVAQGMIRCLPGISPSSPTTTAAAAAAAAAAEGARSDDDEQHLSDADRALVAGTIGFFVAVLERHRLDSVARTIQSGVSGDASGQASIESTVGTEIGTEADVEEWHADEVEDEDEEWTGINDADEDADATDSDAKQANAAEDAPTAAQAAKRRKKSKKKTKKKKKRNTTGGASTLAS